MSKQPIGMWLYAVALASLTLCLLAHGLLAIQQLAQSQSPALIVTSLLLAAMNLI